MRSVRVVAAVVRREGRTLITRRKDDAERGGLWEFPGGKVEAGEAEPAALRREIAEELGCEVAVGELLLRHRHRYPDLDVELAFYACALPEGAAPRAIGVAEIAWAAPGTLASYPFCEADVPVLAALEDIRSP
ncbi:MAG: (deoxy)nucleoside triphosphate pyrophosphohydrolase [Anaeromyxobacteraceae bacterium]